MAGTVENLRIQSDDPWRQGVDCFNRGQFWHAAECWEIPWKSAARDERTWIQGLIQAAAAFHLLARARPAPARRLARCALDKLADWPQAPRGNQPAIRIEGTGGSESGLRPLLEDLSRVSDEEHARSELLSRAMQLRARLIVPFSTL